jgi:hypothetical protein
MGVSGTNLYSNGTVQAIVFLYFVLFLIIFLKINLINFLNLTYFKCHNPVNMIYIAVTLCIIT